jgi:hypothetical protein
MHGGNLRKIIKVLDKLGFLIDTTLVKKIS